MYRRLLTFMILVMAAGFAMAQGRAAEASAGSGDIPAGDLPRNTPAKKDSSSVGEHLKAFMIDDRFATERSVEPDTLANGFQISTTPVYQKTIAAEWLGNLGLPAQSAIFADRHETELTGDYIFRNNYLPYFTRPEDVVLYNTRAPYSNISYYTGGAQRHAEDHLTAQLSINANKRLNFGFKADYIYGRGLYYNQSSDGLTGHFNISYRGERYSLYFIAGLNNFRNFENGGLQSDSSIINMADSYSLATRLTSSNSTFKSFYFWLNNQYSVGYNKRDPDDSEKYEFIPVMTFGYTAKYEGSRKRYQDATMTSGFYPVNFYSSTYSRDSTANDMFRNIFSVTMREGFRKWAVFNLRAFAEVDVERNMYQVWDSAFGYETQALVSVGGELYHREGIVQYGVTGEALVLGSKKRFAFNVEGDFSTRIPIGKETLVIKADGFVRSTNPSYFTERFFSNHYFWHNNFVNTFSASGGGSVGIPNQYCDFEIGANWRGIQNYIFFNKSSVPEQTSDYLQVITGSVKLDLHVKFFHWENTAKIQYSSRSDIIPLPLVSVYSNLYFKWKFFKYLTFQVGVDCRYNTAYYANAYNPATGQYYLQDQTLVGNYPVLNIYLNCHLKQFRFFVMIYNASHWFITPNYFTTPHYALNPAIFKAGLSWNFYN